MIDRTYRYYKYVEAKVWPKSRLSGQIIKLVFTILAMVALMLEFVPGFGESPYNFF